MPPDTILYTQEEPSSGCHSHCRQVVQEYLKKIPQTLAKNMEYDPLDGGKGVAHVRHFHPKEGLKLLALEEEYC